MVVVSAKTGIYDICTPFFTYRSGSDQISAVSSPIRKAVKFSFIVENSDDVCLCFWSDSSFIGSSSDEYDVSTM